MRVQCLVCVRLGLACQEEIALSAALIAELHRRMVAERSLATALEKAEAAAVSGGSAGVAEARAEAAERALELARQEMERNAGNTCTMLPATLSRRLRSSRTKRLNAPCSVTVPRRDGGACSAAGGGRPPQARAGADAYLGSGRGDRGGKGGRAGDLRRAVSGAHGARQRLPA